METNARPAKRAFKAQGGKTMGIATIIVLFVFVVSAVIVLNNGTADKEQKRRQLHWNKY